MLYDMLSILTTLISLKLCDCSVLSLLCDIIVLYNYVNKSLIKISLSFNCIVFYIIKKEVNMNNFVDVYNS